MSPCDAVPNAKASVNAQMSLPPSLPPSLLAPANCHFTLHLTHSPVMAMMQMMTILAAFQMCVSIQMVTRAKDKPLANRPPFAIANWKLTQFKLSLSHAIHLATRGFLFLFLCLSIPTWTDLSLFLYFSTHLHFSFLLLLLASHGKVKF